MNHAGLRLGLAAALALSFASPGASAPRLLGDTTLSIPQNAAFGGLSAIVMDPDGAGAVVMSDRATMFEISFARGAGQGRVTAVTLMRSSPLADAEGRLPLRPDRMDAEGLARLPDGRLALSFEGDMRIAIHGRDGRERLRIAPPPGSDALPRNGAYEGLAADSLGRLYTLAEHAPGRGPTPLFRHASGVWERYGNIPRFGTFRPVGLDFDDRGRLYVLERRFSLGGFASRITRYPAGEHGPGPGEVVLLTPTGRHGNLEGLGLWRRSDGTLVASAVSDNGFRRPDATRLVEYVIPD
ncbi:esterase-like activity of phytase family protein [Roseibacterium sp. SDUM158017]|uniref:esterase-like activity of phytase family protein n=1 Tax=Roseicyclus salinarum TaxID=3036773 RepID=UPI002414DC83|nr:esterase-like activity of phytase family protein [Roseibacterium sp. SDUM158017]MDG4647081.1 esterase-like activity of phytase family protein [Roseibacterium sp. SDUM158017]